MAPHEFSEFNGEPAQGLVQSIRLPESKYKDYLLATDLNTAEKRDLDPPLPRAKVLRERLHLLRNALQLLLDVTYTVQTSTGEERPIAVTSHKDKEFTSCPHSRL